MNGIIFAPWSIALMITLLVQVTVSFLSQAINVLAPNLTEAAGVSHEQIGWLAGLVAAGTVLFLMGGSVYFIRAAPVRLMQLGILLSAAGLLLASIGLWPATILSAFLVGLGYGPAPPASSQILMNNVPTTHQGLIFSVKQSGAPIGSALAGLLLPSLAENRRDGPSRSGRTANADAEGRAHTR